MSDAARRVGLLLRRMAEHNKDVGRRVETWHAQLCAVNPNPRTRLVMVQRVDRWLRVTGYKPLPEAIRQLQGFFAHLAEESSLTFAL